MKRVCCLVLAAFISIESVAQAQDQPPLAPPTDNLISNSSFEGAALPDGAPDGWSMWTNGEKGYRFEVVDGGRTGKKCLKLEGDGVRGVMFAKGVPIDRNKRYALRGWTKFKGDPGARAIILFHYFDKGKWLGLPDVVGVSSATEDWQPLAKTDRADEAPEASMIWISCTLEGKGAAWFDDVELTAHDRKSLPEDFEARYGPSNRLAELDVLARRVGTWNTATTIKPGVWVAAGNSKRGVETVEWTLGQRFLQMKHADQPGNHESLSLETFDGQSGVFRMWYFDSQGNFPRGEYTGKWDEAAATMTYTGTDANGVTATTTQRFVTDDRTEFHGIWRDKSGQILMELDSVSTRSP